MENTIDVANMNIDRTKPKIELIEIQNTNTNYPKYANKTHTISFKIKVTEKNIGKNNFVKDFFGFKDCIVFKASPRASVALGYLDLYCTKANCWTT